MHAEHGVSIRQGCEAVGLPRRTSRYERRAKPDEPIIEALSALVERRHHDLLFLAATRGLILVTRNVGDFAGFDGLHVEDWFEGDEG